MRSAKPDEAFCASGIDATSAAKKKSVIRSPSFQNYFVRFSGRVRQIIFPRLPQELSLRKGKSPARISFRHPNAANCYLTLSDGKIL
jgi:hypothetical protein